MVGNLLKANGIDPAPERNHQGLKNKLVNPGNDVGQTNGIIDFCEQLDHLRRYDHRAAWTI